MEIHSGFLPLPLSGPFGDPLHGSNLGECKAAEKFQIDNLRKQGISFGELIQSFADLNQLAVICRVCAFTAERCDLELTAALLGAAIASVINNEPAHHPRGISHESGSIRERR